MNPKYVYDHNCDWYIKVTLQETDKGIFVKHKETVRYYWGKTHVPVVKRKRKQDDHRK